VIEFTQKLHLGLLNPPDFDHRICGADLVTRSKMYFLQYIYWRFYISWFWFEIWWSLPV